MCAGINIQVKSYENQSQDWTRKNGLQVRRCPLLTATTRAAWGVWDWALGNLEGPRKASCEIKRQLLNLCYPESPEARWRQNQSRKSVPILLFSQPPGLHPEKVETKATEKSGTERKRNTKDSHTLLSHFRLSRWKNSSLGKREILTLNEIQKFN